jgi:hypothetical protein
VPSEASVFGPEADVFAANGRLFGREAALQIFLVNAPVEAPIRQLRFPDLNHFDQPAPAGFLMSSIFVLGSPNPWRSIARALAHAR